MKKHLSFLVVCLMIVSCVAIPVEATDANIYDQSVIIDLSDIENNPDVSVSEVMTFSEMVERYAKNAGITYQEALSTFPNVPVTNSTNDIFYRVYTATLGVTATYKPHIEFFCESAEGGHFHSILSIYNVQLVRSYNGISKEFSGTVDTWLRTNCAIEYAINGDFYNNGTTTITTTSSTEIGVDGLFSLGYSASATESSNHYQYFYDHQTRYY